MADVFENFTPAPYEGASRGRRMAGWRASSSGPNNTVGQSLDMLRRRSRDAARNSATAAAVITKWTSALVGFGISARPDATDPVLKAKLTDLWAAWCRVADVDGGNFDSMQQLAVRAWLESGECFVRIRARRPTDGLPVPMQLQLLESDSLPMLDADTYAGMPNGNCIRQGIEFDAIGRRVAYWLWKQHPGDKVMANIAVNDLSRVPAEQVCHLYEPTRPGQLRGVPILAPILAKLRTVEDFDDATLERQRLANLFVTFITRPTASGANDPMTGTPYEGSADQPLLGLEPGTSQELLPGEDVRFSEPPGPASEYDAYMRRQLLELASGVGLPYEMLSSDLKDVSDRTLRAAINEFRRLCDAKIWGVIVPRLLAPIRNQWASMAFIGGQLTQDEAGAALAVTWQPQAHAPLHPTQDLQAMQMAVDAGFRSRSSVIAALGDDPAAVDTERAADKERADKLGLQTPDEAKAAAELAKLEAEAQAAEKAAQASLQQAQEARARASEAKASVDVLKAQQKTADALRTHDVAAAADRAKVARLETQAAEFSMAELTGGRGPGRKK